MKAALKTVGLLTQRLSFVQRIQLHAHIEYLSVCLIDREDSFVRAMLASEFRREK